MRSQSKLFNIPSLSIISFIIRVFNLVFTATFMTTFSLITTRQSTATTLFNNYLKVNICVRVPTFQICSLILKSLPVCWL